jgi:lysine 6-dehydrogenase
MRLLVIGAGMMGSAAAFDMARSPRVSAVTIADSDRKRVKAVAARLNRMTKGNKVRAAVLDAGKPKDARKLMKGHQAVLSAVPYFFNVGLCGAAVDAGCHFADLGGNNVAVRKELAMAKKAANKGLCIAPDCGLSPGMASILAGELLRRVGGQADFLKIYVGGLPQNPKPPFNYQMVFSVEGLINEYCEPALILRGGKITRIDPLSEPEDFHIEGFPTLTGFHTSGGTSTMPENFAGRVGEVFEKTLRYKGHFEMIRALYDLGLFSSEKRKIGKLEIAPRQVMSDLFLEKFAGKEPDVTIMRIEAHRGGRVDSFTLVDRYDPETKMTSMMRTTAWPAAIVTMMMAAGDISRRGAVYQETDVPAQHFIDAMAARGIRIDYDRKG